MVGWIYSPDTVINYPVMKGETNDTYLHTMLNGQYNSSGSIFMDYRNNPDLSDYGLFEDEESFREFVNYAIAKSDFQSRYDYSKAEHLMVLSTCSYEYDDARYIIVGIPIPESK